MITRTSLAGLTVLLLAGCGGAPVEGTPLNVPSDAGAQYFVLEKAGTPDLRTIVTKRVGSSGTTYSRREVNCAQRTVRYLGTGDTKEQMNAGPADPAMGPIMPGSIADVVASEACRD
jgi:hypothetical protein